MISRDVTWSVDHVFIFSSGALVLVIKGSVWEIVCEIDLVVWYQVVGGPHFSVENMKVHKIGT